MIPSLPHAHADADQMLQVILNLLKNASEARVSAVARSGCARSMSIRSVCAALAMRAAAAAADRDRSMMVRDCRQILEDSVFDPFVSGRENGTGLGLALVSKIIADHGGWVAVDSVPGHTAFRISLPVATADALEKKDIS